MATKQATTEIVLPKLEPATMEITLVGDSPLVAHKWSEKAKEMMRAKQQKKATAKREAKDPEAEFEAARYRMPDGRDGFPVTAFKKAAVDACSHVSGVTKVEARGAFHVNLSEELIPLEIQAAPKMREDIMRVGMGVADLRYRPHYEPWSVRLNIHFNPNVLSAEQIVNLFNTAGFAIGVGEGRPQKNGQFGMFHVATDGEV